MINAQEIQGQWNTIRGQLKQKWGQLTDSDLDIQNGNIDELVGRIQEKTGEGREVIETYLNTLTSKTSSGIAQAAGSVRDFAQKAGERVREGYGQFSDDAAEHYERARSMVRHRPGESVATAFGIGLVVGVVVGLAFRSR